MSHAVSMDFPNNRRGRFLKWLFTAVLDGPAKLFDHTDKEFVFQGAARNPVDAASNPASDPGGP